MDTDWSVSLVALGVGALVVLAVMSAGLASARRTERLTIVDTLWGLGFVAVGLASALVSLTGDGDPVLPWVLAGLTAVWGVRLSAYLHRRNHGQAEDPRYAELASADGRSFAEVALRRVFLPQGIAMYLVATPLMVGAGTREPVWWLVGVGVSVWLLGFVFESVGDAQLARFKADPTNRGQLMDRGLWRYTRHPNYFGDACVWTGLWLVAASSWGGLATVVSPIAMTFFLTKVTGAANNEKGMKKSKPGYDEYVRRTSGFVPWFPKKA
jgi:steroid 5-alpha reductase family enzyme